MYNDYDGMTDEEIALLAQQGDADASEYLLNKYKNFVRSRRGPTSWWARITRTSCRRV